MPRTGGGGEEIVKEFEKAVDLKTRHLRGAENAYVSPIEYRVAGPEPTSGVFTEEIVLGKGVTASDISMSLKGRILTVELKKKEKSGAWQEFGKMFTLPKNVDTDQLTSVLTSEGNLKISAPYQDNSSSSSSAPTTTAAPPSSPQQRPQYQQQQQRQQQQQPSASPQQRPQYQQQQRPAAAVPAPAPAARNAPAQNSPWGPSVSNNNSQPIGGGNPAGKNLVGDTPGSLAVELHNQFRRKHGAPPLILSVQLCDQAQAYSTAVVNGRKGEHEAGTGRNIFQIQTTGVSMSPLEAVREAVNTWYDHHTEYDWNSPLASPQYAKLFTQLVWKSSQALGVGVATKGGVTVVTCLYSPGGNIVSDQRYKENVFRSS